MKVQHTWKYLSLLVVLGFWGCSSSKNLAGESDDLYGSSADAPVYASKESRPVERTRTASQRYEDSRMNANPDYNDQTLGLGDDEYYSEVTARKVTRGISPDPGWSSDNSYTNGFANGYNTAMMNSSWNRWGWNSPFFGGMNLGIGLGMSSWGWGGLNSWRYGGFYDPFWGGSYAYSPFYGGGFGGGFYDPFYAYSPFGYGYGFNSFYNPYMYGGGYGRPVIVNNYDRIGANRNATYGARRGVSRDRYNSDFVNTPRSYNNNNGGRRSGERNSANNTANNTYYSRPNNSGGTVNTGSYGTGRANSRGSYYYGESGSGGSRSNTNPSGRPSYTTPSTNNSDYYAAPRQNSRGTYSAPSYNSGSRVGASQETRTYQAPSRSYEAPQRTYSPPSQPSYSSPSFGGSRGGGGSSGGGGGYSGGGGSRGPR
ncbi:hypothetical protein ACFQ4C_02685 [Larkinella insperata]|uniref:Prolyl-tRNA synthetase n=1 Tax=Larkinella insperata TaxID=332158 RepID=A0ABW3Q9G8_9BACT|nr:hypothetical protein [Larkinella insperata]